MKLATVFLLTLPILPAFAGTGRTPVLLELFTSEGCSSCPPADQLLQALDRQQPFPDADLIVLSEHVDYWNHGGWADPYSSPGFSQRQQAYASRFGLDAVYTPQLVIDGTAEIVGSNAGRARTQITKAAGHSKLPIMLSNAAREGNRVSVHVQFGALADAKGRANIYLALADNEDESQVSRGENAGRDLRHVAVVRVLEKVGIAGGSDFSKDITMPAPAGNRNGLRIVAFVQDQHSGRILAVSQDKL